MKRRLVEFKIANYSSAKIQQKKKKCKNENLSEELLSWMFILCLHWLCLACIACSHYPTFSINVKEANKVNVYFHIKIKMYNEHKYQSITAGLTALKHLNPNISETKASVLWLPPQIMNKTYWEWLKHFWFRFSLSGVWMKCPVKCLLYLSIDFSSSNKAKRLIFHDLLCKSKGNKQSFAVHCKPVRIDVEH